MSFLNKAKRVQANSDGGTNPGPLPYDINDRNDKSPPPEAAAAPPCAQPPPGARLFFQGEDGRPCGPEEAYLWCWERGPSWFYVSDVPPPPQRVVLRGGR